MIRYCTEQGVKILIAPPIDEVIDGKIMKQSIREIKIEDLLGRPEIRISMDEIIANFRGRTILNAQGITERLIADPRVVAFDLSPRHE